MSDSPVEPGAESAVEPDATRTEPASGLAAEPQTEPASEADALLSRLRVIEDQPLESRAAAFAQLHDELQHRLEGGDSPHPHA